MVCFNDTITDEFFRKVFRTRFYETLEELQADLDKWLMHYNTERPRQGYRNMGRRPMDTINEYFESKIQKAGIPDSAKENSWTVRNDT